MANPGGSGRGNIGTAVVDTDRPDCPLCGGFLHSEGKRWYCKACNYGPLKEHKKSNAISRLRKEPAGFDTVAAEKHARRCEKGKRLVVTSAQNNTDVNPEFFASLKTLANYYSANIAIIPNHYKNVTLTTNEKKQWVDEVTPFLVKTDINFGSLKVKSDARINATTRHPLASKGPINGSTWTVFGHPQVARQSVAAPGGVKPKVMFTTGSITKNNYSDSNDGLIADFNHTISALIIERDGDRCFVRQIMAGHDGEIYDLDKKFTATGWEKARIKAITTGDEHWRFNTTESITFGKGGIVDTLKPEYIIRHDVYDGYSGSHHHRFDPVLQFLKHHNGDNDVRKELDQCIDAINRTTPKYAKTLLVPSNHHDHLSKWLSSSDINTDHQNALLISELQAATRKAALMGGNRDPFYLYAAPRLSCKHEFLDRNKAYLVDEIDVSQHGDVGVNGSRASARQLALTSHKMTVGHSHTPGIVMGVFQAGTSTDRLDYEKGLSSHSQAHVLQYANSKRAIIDIIDGRWRL